MTAKPIIDPDVFLHEQLAQASPDLMRELLTTPVNALLSRRPTACAAPSTAPARRPPSERPECSRQSAGGDLRDPKGHFGHRDTYLRVRRGAFRLRLRVRSIGRIPGCGPSPNGPQATDRRWRHDPLTRHTPRGSAGRRH
jgi:hypothetical protein